jgi:hypothetical protein
MASKDDTLDMRVYLDLANSINTPNAHLRLRVVHSAIEAQVTSWCMHGPKTTSYLLSVHTLFFRFELISPEGAIVLKYSTW